MALFAIWPDDGEGAAVRHRLLREAAHVVPECTIGAKIETPGGAWQLAVFVTATHFYSAEEQVWTDPARGACVIHGLIWRTSTGRLLDAAMVAALLDRPGAQLPDDVAGEYAIARLHGDGTLEAFGDPAGLHHLFHAADGRPILANRAAFVALICGMAETGREGALWLGTIGYRIGTESSWAGVAQLAQGARLAAKRAGSQVGPRHFTLPEQRGFAQGGTALVEEGLKQAKAAIRLVVGDGILDLPITGGKDSRVVLAIALAAGLKDRLTYEPVANLDARAEHDVYERRRELAAGRTVVLITHRMASVREADRIYVLDHGAIVEEGDHAALMAAGGIYSQLFTLQASAYQSA